MEIGKLLKRIVAQNEIIIRQNEELLRLFGAKAFVGPHLDERALKRLAELRKMYLKES